VNETVFHNEILQNLLLHLKEANEMFSNKRI